MNHQTRVFIIGWIGVAIFSAFAVSLTGCGKKDGPVKAYYENGKTKDEGVFKSGKLDGPFKRLYKNGQVELEGIVKSGRLDGPVKSYYETGQIKSESVCL